MAMPVCTVEAPIRPDDNRSAHHPHMGPLRINVYGHVIMWCPICKREWNTKLPESELDAA